MAGATAQAQDAARFADAHRALLADPAIQFRMGPVPKPPEPPKWWTDFLKWLGEVFRPVGRFLRWIGSFMPDAPYARILLWGVIGLAAALLVWVVVERLRSGEWRWPLKRKRARTADVDVPVEEEWAPDAAPVRAWLREADALAAEGKFAEAAHHLLFRSIEDVERRRPREVRPSLTSRDIGALPSLPGAARRLFVDIAALVERSLFGGRPVSADDWTGARAAYADLALPQAWRA